MNCQEWEERIALCAGGDATPAEAAEVERHVAECARCEVLYNGLRESLALLQAEHREPIGEAHFAAVRTRVLAEIQSARAPRWRVWVYALTAVAAALVLWIGVRPAARPALPAPKIAVVTPAPRPTPLAVEPATPQPAVIRARGNRTPAYRPRRPESAETLTIKLVTDNPDVVIYWIAEKKGD